MHGNGTAAAVGFVTPFHPAGTLSAIQLDADVTDFTGTEGFAAAHQSVCRNDAAADAAAQGQVDEIPAPFARPEKPLSQRAAVGIVLKTAGDLQFIFQIIEDRHIAPQRIVGRFGHDASGGIGGERGGNTECRHIAHLQSGFADQPF